MSISEWINETFFGMDASIFRFTNEMLNENPFIFKIARFISYFGDHGIFFIALAIVGYNIISFLFFINEYNL